MAKPGLASDKAGHLLEVQAAHRGFTLCVGAGTSLNADGRRPHPFPLWGELVDRLVARADPRFAAKSAPPALRSFGFDALIQAAANRLGGSDEAFAEVLATELYADLRAAVPVADWPLFARCLEAHKPADVVRADWERFHGAVVSAFPTLTALGLAEALVEVADGPRAPLAVLSFNAEPLLFALLNATIALGTKKGSGKQRFDCVTRAVAPRDRSRVPFYFCHGLLPVPASASKTARRAAVDKLVFSESDYLSLANTSFAWQSSVFLNACATSTVIFVGLSMTDPNMRRWLAWVHENRRDELRRTEAHHGDSTSHFWIHKRPSTAEEQEWIELSLAHLGVRLVWVEQWTELGPLFRRMLGLV